MTNARDLMSNACDYVFEQATLKEAAELLSLSSPHFLNKLSLQYSAS